MVSIALFSLAITGVYSIQSTAFRNQSIMVRKTIVENNATILGEAMRDAASAASYIQTPSVGSTTDELLIWSNVDPSDGSTPLVAGLARTFSYFCTRNTVGFNGVYFYEGSWPLPPITCGDAPPSGVSQSLVVGQEIGLTVTPTFTRAVQNELQLAYTVQSTVGAATIVNHSTKITIQNAAN